MVSGEDGSLMNVGSDLERANNGPSLTHAYTHSVAADFNCGLDLVHTPTYFPNMAASDLHLVPHMG